MYVEYMYIKQKGYGIKERRQVRHDHSHQHGDQDHTGQRTAGT